MQLPLIRSSSESTAAVTKLAKPMLVMKRPRFSTCRSGSWPSSHESMRNLPETTPVSTPTKGSGSVRAKAPRLIWRSSPGCGGVAMCMYLLRCSGVPFSWIGERPRLLARDEVAAPPSTQASSKATSAKARFLGPSMKPPSAGSIKTWVSPASSKAVRILSFSGVQSWVLRAPLATRLATTPRATPRVDCTTICRS